MSPALSRGLKVSDETKSRLQAELEEEKEKARKYIRRHVRFRRTIILMTIQTAFYIPYLLGIFYISRELNPPSMLQNLTLLFTIPFTVVIYLIALVLARRGLRGTSKLTCLYTSVNAAQSFEKGDIVEGSFLMTKLCEFLKPFAEEEKVQIGLFPSTLKKLYLGNIEKLHEQKTAVGKTTIENPTLTVDYSNHLYILADSLFSSKTKPNYDKANEALGFFTKNSEKYFEPATYLQQHRKLSSALKALSEVGKIAMVPLLLFVLWLIFGYR